MAAVYTRYRFHGLRLVISQNSFACYMRCLFFFRESLAFVPVLFFAVFDSRRLCRYGGGGVFFYGEREVLVAVGGMLGEGMGIRR